MDNTPELNQWTIADRIDSYFMQTDNKERNNSKQEQLLDSVYDSDMELKKEYVWKFRHTVSYWISIFFIFGSLLFTTGSFFWIMTDSITSSDYYTLVIVAYFVGGLSFEIGSYATYYGIINEANKNKKKRIYFLMPGKWTLGYKSSFIFFVGGSIAKYGLIVDVAKISYVRGDIIWTVYKICSFIGNTSFFIAGILAMKLNECWKWRPYKLGWIVSWFNAVGGMFFFIAGIGAIINNEMVQIITVRWAYFLGSFCYLIASIAALFMWKLQQFGYIYLPDLNKNDKLDPIWKRKRNAVLYRDILFINLYVITAALGVTAISYSIQCSKYSDWIKNYLLVTIGSIGVLSLGSIIHREPEKAPFSYLIWFLRFYIIFYTINLCVDSYHISGQQCQIYGN